MENGYIKLYRSFRDWYGYKSHKRLALWVELLFCASHKEKECLFNGKFIQITPGQFVTGRKLLGSATGISETHIERILSEFEKMGQIGQQKSSTSRLITIVKWVEYQDKDSGRTTKGQQKDNKRTAEGHNQEGKNDKNGRNKEIASQFSFDEIWNKYPNKDGKKFAERSFKATVKTEQDWQDINKAINNYLQSEKVQKGFIKNGSTWFNNWKDWVDFIQPVKPDNQEIKNKALNDALEAERTRRANLDKLIADERATDRKRA